MRSFPWIVALVAGLGLGPTRAAAGDDDYWAAVTGATRELSRQVDFLGRSIATIPGPSEGRGLFKQCDGIQLDLAYFRLKLRDKASRDDLDLAFTSVDGKVTQLLGELEPFGKWAPAVGLATRRTKSAQHDLQFALSAGDKDTERQTQTMYRQTLGLLARVEDLDSIVRYVFYEHDTIDRWVAALKEMRRAVTDLQTLQQKKAASAAVKAQVVQMETAWGKVLTMFKDLTENQNFMLQADAVQVDKVLDRFDKAFDLKGRARVPNNSLFQ